MEVKDIISQVESIFGRKPNKYLMQLINDGLMDIASKRLTNEDTAVTDLLKDLRYDNIIPDWDNIKEEIDKDGLEYNDGNAW